VQNQAPRPIQPEPALCGRLEWVPGKSQGVNRHTAWYTSPYPSSRSVMLVPGWTDWLAEISANLRKAVVRLRRVGDDALYKSTVTLLTLLMIAVAAKWDYTVRSWVGLQRVPTIILGWSSVMMAVLRVNIRGTSSSSTVFGVLLTVTGQHASVSENRLSARCTLFIITAYTCHCNPFTSDSTLSTWHALKIAVNECAYSFSRMHVMNHNWSAGKQRLHLQNAAGISWAH